MKIVRLHLSRGDNHAMEVPTGWHAGRSGSRQGFLLPPCFLHGAQMPLKPLRLRRAEKELEPGGKRTGGGGERTAAEGNELSLGSGREDAA